MDAAEWTIVAILCITLMVFLLTGISLMVKLINFLKEVQKAVEKGQDIAENVNGVVNNVRGMTALGGTMEMLVDKYINPKVKEKINQAEARERSKNGKKRAEE